ncbi:MAG: hypothetical protein JKY84_10315 [Emcibacteraceae bacterium]|nr:hypothetical protein [Emcibacteraceae bacterium]
MTKLTEEYFLELDKNDELARFRDEFYIPEDTIYLDGNSLGAMPLKAMQRAQKIVEDEWGKNLIKSWNTAGWFELPYKLGDKIASLIGANGGEVVVTDSTGINIFKVISAALSIRPERSVIVMEGSNFPTDNYMAQGLVELLGHKHEIRFAEIDTLIDAIDQDVAVICLSMFIIRPVIFLI